MKNEKTDFSPDNFGGISNSAKLRNNESGYYNMLKNNFLCPL